MLYEVITGDIIDFPKMVALCKKYGAWLFADTPKGATANAVLYTLVETAKANGLDAYEYLKYLLEELRNNFV